MTFDGTAACGRLAPGRRVYAIGDLHGCVDLLDEIHRRIATDLCRRPVADAIVVYLGDYISRGPFSRQLVDTLIARPLASVRTVHLKGNHEDIVLRFLDGDLKWGEHWLNYGGVEALASYGIEAEPTACPQTLAALLDAFTVALPQHHLDFFRGLAVSWRCDGYVFVHAGLRPGVPLDEQTEHDMLWIRRRFLFAEDDFGAMVVHGHCISPKPELRHNRIGIDTGASQSGILTCAVLEGGDCHFLQTGQPPQCGGI